MNIKRGTNRIAITLAGIAAASWPCVELYYSLDETYGHSAADRIIVVAITFLFAYLIFRFMAIAIVWTAKGFLDQDKLK